MAKRLTPTELSSAKNWCSDNLHELLGFADSALAGFLVDVASSSSSGGKNKKKNHGDGDGSVRRVMQTLKDGGVNGDEGRLLNFAQELCRRCGSGGGGDHDGVGTSKSAASTSNKQSTSTSSSNTKRPVTNADMMKRAANYSLMDIEEPELQLPERKRTSKDNNDESVPGTIVTKSSRGSDDKVKGSKSSSSSRRSKEDKSNERSKSDTTSNKEDRERSKKEDRRNRRRRIHSSSS